MDKTKVFITSIPFLGKKRQKDGTMKDGLEAVTYNPVGNPALEYLSQTRFPIIPVINAYANAGDKIRVIAIIAEGEESNAKNTRYNYETYFKPEVKEICAVKGLMLCSGEIEPVYTPDKEDMDTQLKLFSDIADMINEENEIYACITYGTKPMPIILTMALSYAHRTKKDVSVQCIVYGRFPHLEETGKPTLIYDITSLFHMDSIVNKLVEIKAPNPHRAIKLMLGLLPSEDMEDDEL